MEALSQETLSLRKALDESRAGSVQPDSPSREWQTGVANTGFAVAWEATTSSQAQPSKSEVPQSTSSMEVPQPQPTKKAEKVDEVSAVKPSAPKKPKAKAKSAEKAVMDAAVFAPPTEVATKSEDVPAPSRKSKTKGVKNAKNVSEPAAKVKEVAQAKKQDAAEKVSEAKPKKTVKVKSTASTKTDKSEESDLPDWSKLSESTLKRKTLKELSGYLKQKVCSFSLCLSLCDCTQCCLTVLMWFFPLLYIGGQCGRR